MLTGLIYPYIADLIFRRLEKIQLDYRRKQKEKASIKPGNTPGQTTAAGLYRFTEGNYDFQALAGVMQSDYVVGGGWSGVLGKAGF